MRLFQRTTRTQSLTEAGQQFYEHCLRAVAELRTGEALLESGRQEVAGRLRISMPVLLGRRCAAPILLDYAKAHPKLELDLNFSDRVIDLIADGFDLGLRFGALGNNSSLRARRLVTERMVLCASPSYLDARGRPEELADLAGHDALAYARGDRGYAWRLPDANGVLVPVSPHSQAAVRRRRSHSERRQGGARPLLAPTLADPRQPAKGVNSSSSGRSGPTRPWIATPSGPRHGICRCGHASPSMRSPAGCRVTVSSSTLGRIAEPPGRYAGVGRSGGGPIRFIGYRPVLPIHHRGAGRS